MIASDGDVINDATEKAELFASIFAANSHIDDQGKSPPVFRPPATVMNPVIFSTSKTHKLLLQLDTNKATGSDQIPAIVLKKCAPELAPVLTRLFRLCLKSGVCPTSWKDTDVCPVPKKGSRSNHANYRPIAITPVLCKVMESLINTELLLFLENNNLIHDRQYGFRKARSTGDILAYVTNLWSSILDKSGESAVISLDISKAFDRVWHKSLVNKLIHSGLSTSLVNWINDFLANRSITARVDGVKSSSRVINAGVPQGSVFAPTLFLIFINDLTLHTGIRSTNGRQSAAVSLNSDVDRILQWGDANLVKFNESKTHLMVVSHEKDVALFPDVLMNDDSIHIYLGRIFIFFSGIIGQSSS